MNSRKVDPAVRLIEDPATREDLASALRAARGEGPSDHRMTALEALLSAQTGAGDGGDGGAGPAKTGASVESVPAVSGVVGRAARLWPWGAALGGATALVGILLLAGGPSVNAPSVAPPAPPTKQASPPRQAAHASPARDVPVEAYEDGTAPAESLRAVTESPRAPRRSSPRSPGSGRAAAPREELSELQLIEGATGSLANDPARALSLVQRAERAYARGNFVPEREVISIQAHLRLGHRARARRQADAFVEAHPDSVYLDRVRGLFASESTPEP